MKYDTATPYAAAYVLLHKAGHLAFVLRGQTGYMDGYYGLPSGKVEPQERVMQACVREAKEEVGIDIDEASLRHAMTVHRKGEDGTFWVDAYFEVKDWQGEPYNAEPNKHRELAWLDPANLPDNIVPSVRDALQQISAGKSYSEFGWSA